jgi:hypothetical protein
VTPSLLRRALRGPLVLAREAFDRLPAETQIHARAATDESVAALRSLADGATDATERAIDRIAAVISGR